MTALPSGALVAWYGDDFTGSAATMEALTFAGLDSVLFLEPPTPEQSARFAGARGVGIASTARSHSPDWMRRHIPPAFEHLLGTGAPIIHYKTCSTLDSAPEVGSIGCAMDLAAPLVGGDWIPCLIAAPPMRRYQCFGHLFASAPEGVFRLDRHPVMARHPVTPMHESDVARHLGAQTEIPFALLDLEALGGDAERRLEAALAGGAKAVSLDCLSADDMAACGRLIWEHRGERLLAVGSQGVEYALIEYWRRAGLLENSAPPASAGGVERLAAVSGSVSPVTAAQISWAEANGFEVIEFDAAVVGVGDDAAREAAVADALRRALVALSGGRDPLICTARGPDDPAVTRTRAAIAVAGVDNETANARIGAALGRTLGQLLRQSGLTRAVISGGDSSGHAARQLDLFAFTALAPTIPGAALLKAHSNAPEFAALELALKGGQMGSPDYFGWIKEGGGER